MTEESLRDRRILIVEDEYMIAEFLQYELEDAGAIVAGMIGNVDEGLQRVRDGLAVDAAILDVNLGGQAVFPLADELASRGIPFVFTTGYDASSIPPRFKQVERYVKPYNTAAMLGGIARIIDATP